MLDEDEKIIGVERYHHRKRIRLPNAHLHATFHVVVENQVAMGDSYPAKSVLERLRREGLDRHEAVHAIASVLTEQVFVKYKDSKTDLNAEYLGKLERLTAESWRKQYSEEAGGS